MFFSTKKLIKKLINLGFVDEFDNDLNQKHVVNFSYLLFCISSLLMLVFFSFHQSPFVVFLFFSGFVLGLMGLRYNYIGYFSRAQLLMPIVKMVSVSILSLFYFGTDSSYHWLFVGVIAYAFIVFRADQRSIRNLVVVGSVVLFLICEFLGVKGVYLTARNQNIVVSLVFLSVAFNFAVMINLVMSRLKAVNQHLRILAEKDELTGLPNRRKVLADAVNTFADSVINRESCVFAIVDLDHFKKINDTFGHEAGDLVLTQVAKTMKSVIRPKDEIGRYGGEEFIVIMRETGIKEAKIVMEEIRSSVEDMFIETEQGIVIPVTISAGLAAITPSVSRYEEILAEADKGLYLAKRSGRNRIAVQSDTEN